MHINFSTRIEKRKSDDEAFERNSPEPNARPSKRLRSSSKKTTPPTVNADPAAATTSTNADADAKVEQEAETMTFVRDPKYYFDEGDIILRVGETMFRVHRDRLYPLGGVFEDMFSLPQPEDAEKIDGAPFCDIALISPRIMSFLIAYVYGDIVLVEKSKSPSGPEILYWNAAVALLEASHKLSLGDLRIHVIAAFQTIFPCDPIYQPTKPSIRGVRTVKGRALFQRVFPLQAINLFREYNIPSLTPMAYYCAAQLSVDDIIHGVVRSDGVREILCSYDMAQVITGRELLKLSRRTVLFGWLNSLTRDGKYKKPSEECTELPLESGESCFSYLMRLFMDFNRNLFLDSRPDGLQPLPEVSKVLMARHLCESCQVKVEEQMENGLQTNWEELPVYFGFKGWNDVMDRQACVDAGWD